MTEPTKPFSAIITGSSGMVGRAVLLECLASAAIDRVLVVNRSPIDLRHPKMEEIIHADFTDLAPIRDRLGGYAACFFCAGVSSIGMDEASYTRLTYELTTAFARALLAVNPDMTFNYVSGMGTDGTERGRSMWARVKGRTENALLSMGFRDAYMFRLGMMLPDTEVRSKTGWVNTLLRVLRPLYPLLARSSWAITSSEFGRAMINTVLYPQLKKVLESKDVNALARA